MDRIGHQVQMACPPHKFGSLRMRPYLRVQATAETGLTREETLQGRQYLVLPVVALVQGVVFGANSEAPEFAPASEFGKNIQGWNGRPVVMNHPQDEDGDFVAANSPEIVNDWAFGWMFGAHVSEGKLKVEAWVDIARAEEKGGDFAETLQRLKDGELVEVSVGVFINPVSKSGTYKGKAYKSVWSNVVPDHLALLSNGSTGACSVEDGCGAPRLNEATAVMADKVSGEVTSTNPDAGVVDPTPSSAQPKLTPNGAHDCACKGGHTTLASGDDADLPTDEVPTDLQVAQMRSYSSRFAVNALPSDRFNTDIAKAVYSAIRKHYRGYCYGYTTDVAVFDSFDEDYNYVCKKVGINVSSDLVVEFTSEPTEVQIVMQIIDKSEDTMSTNTTTQVDGSAPIVTAVETPAPSPVTLESYIAGAPKEIRSVLESGLAVQKARAEALVKAILSTNTNAFSEAELASMDVGQLEKLATLAKAGVPTANSDYSGMGAPRLVTQEAASSFAPEPARVWG